MFTAAQWKSYEARLEQEQKRLREELDRFPETLADEHPGYSTHMADDASDVFEQAKNLALRQNLERELELVDLALQKLREGNWGVCERCGEPINPERLDAMPQARYCLPCQKHLEKNLH